MNAAKPSLFLSHEIITKKPTSHSKYEGSSIVFLHGILGSAQNLRSFARKVANAYPGTYCLLVDLRAHGESPTMVSNEDSNTAVSTVDDCANDVAHLMKHLNIKPNVLWGHSFGGKVVLSLLSNKILSRHVNAASTTNTTTTNRTICGIGHGAF